MTTPPQYPPFDRLVRKEEALGAIREILPPTNHVGLAEVAPFMNVRTDEVIFDYIKGGLSDGLAPARAEDAESELSQKDEGMWAQGRASVIDWALKDKYTASDVKNYRDAQIIRAQLAGISDFQIDNTGVGSVTADFDERVAREDQLRTNKLLNRMEWLIMTSLEKGKIDYDDGKIAFEVDYERPANQQDQTPTEIMGTSTPDSDDVSGDQDPIGNLLAVQEFMWDTYKVTLSRAYISRRILSNIWKNKRFIAAFIPGFGLNGTPSTAIDPNYAIPNWNPQMALDLVSQATGITFTVYDSVWRSRPIGSNVITNNRFTNDNKVILLPDPQMMQQIDDTQIGFAKTLTSPHPEGLWTPGFYEWEQTKMHDPWLTERGTGIKAFPVFPFMEYSYVMQVMDPA